LSLCEVEGFEVAFQGFHVLDRTVKAGSQGSLVQLHVEGKDDERADVSLEIYVRKKS
jgi:hypothetical protein